MILDIGGEKTFALSIFVLKAAYVDRMHCVDLRFLDAYSTIRVTENKSLHHKWFRCNS